MRPSPNSSPSAPGGYLLVINVKSWPAANFSANCIEGGPGGERDNVTSIEHLTGSAYNDDLEGGERARAPPCARGARFPAGSGRLIDLRTTEG